MQNVKEPEQLDFIHEYIDLDEKLLLKEKATKAKSPQLLTEVNNGTSN